MADEEKLSARDNGDLAKLRDEYSIHDALGGASGGTCSDCQMYEMHGIHWVSCGNRGRIHMGWCSIKAWKAFRKDWFEEFGEMADFKQEAREKVTKAIEKGTVFRVEIAEGHPNKKPAPASVPKNTVADRNRHFIGIEMNTPTPPRRKEHEITYDAKVGPFKEGDEIEHPAHYNMFPVEAIDVCEHLGFNLGNVVKYVMRADFKGDRIKDLKKALFYLQREIAR